MNYSKRFVVEPGARVKLRKIDPGYIDPDVTEKDALAETKKLCKRLRELQASLYSEKQRSVLIVPIAVLVPLIFFFSEVTLMLIATCYVAIGLALHILRMLRHRSVSHPA